MANQYDRTGKSRKTHSVAQSSESIKAVINQCRPDLMLDEGQSSLATMFLLPVCKCFDSRESYLFTAARGSFAFVFLIHHISTMVVTESFPSKYVRVHVDLCVVRFFTVRNSLVWVHVAVVPHHRVHTSIHSPSCTFRR